MTSKLFDLFVAQLALTDAEQRADLLSSTKKPATDLEKCIRLDRNGEEYYYDFSTFTYKRRKHRVDILLTSEKPIADPSKLLRVEYFNGDVFYYDFAACECEENYSQNGCRCLEETTCKLACMACVTNCSSVSQIHFDQVVEVINHYTELDQHLSKYGEDKLAQVFPIEEENYVGSQLFAEEEDNYVESQVPAEEEDNYVGAQVAAEDGFVFALDEVY